MNSLGRFQQDDFLGEPKNFITSEYGTFCMLLSIVLGICTLGLAYFVWRFSMEATQLRARYGHIVDVAAAVAAAKHDLERTQQEYNSRRAAAERDFSQLEQEHRLSLE